jgi:WNK lysine deficient protein kinase
MKVITGSPIQIVIGDLGLATVVDSSHKAHSFLGTPEYMAPELFEQDYNELVDIYSFGLCVLELFTAETPFTECTGVAQIYKKVITGVRPDALNRLQESNVKRFIERCLGQPWDRPSAAQLLHDPFFFELDYCSCLLVQPALLAREDQTRAVDAELVVAELNQPTPE